MHSHPHVSLFGVYDLAIPRFPLLLSRPPNVLVVLGLPYPPVTTLLRLRFVTTPGFCLFDTSALDIIPNVPRQILSRFDVHFVTPTRTTYIKNEQFYRCSKTCTLLYIVPMYFSPVHLCPVYTLDRASNDLRLPQCHRILLS